MRRRIIAAIFLLVTCFASTGEGAELIRAGTLAPRGSAWGQALDRLSAALLEASAGELRFQFHFGIDEEDLVELIRNRQLDAVSLTSAGMAQILPSASLFQAPLLFATYEELDHAKRELTGTFVRRFEEQGYVFLGWGELGFIYLFSKAPIRTQTDLQKRQIWVMTIDPMARAFASASGREPVLLPFHGVLPALRSDEIQTVYASPLACIAFQWHTEISYVTDLRLAAGMAGTILDRGRFERLSTAHQSLLLEAAGKYHQEMVGRIRRSNREAMDWLRDHQVETVAVPDQEKQKWVQVAQQVQNQFAGQLYDGALLEQTRRLIRQVRER